MDIHPIRNEQDHGAALAEIDRLWGAPEGTPEAGALEVWVTLVHAYEEQREPIDPPRPIEAIKFRMDQLGWSRRDLEPYIGSRGRVSEVLSGKRRLTLDMIRRLRDGLGISADVLLGPPGSSVSAA